MTRLAYLVLTCLPETRLLISRWLSELDFKGTHQQHVAEREEGTGKISSRLEPEFSYWFNGEQDYVWLRGDRKAPATIHLSDNDLADSR